MDQDEIKEEIKRRTDIVELISQYVPLKRAGRRMKGLCPFHQEKTPSFFVDPAGGFWKCFGCGEGGDVFSFLMKIEGLTFPEAGERLAERAGLVWKSTPGADERSQLRKQIQSATDIAIEHFQANLQGPQGAAARDYLQRRGFAEQTVTEFRLGFAANSWDDLLRALARKGISGEMAVQAGVARAREGGGQYDWFRNRIIFPIMDAGGRVIAFGGRTLDPDEDAKYINSPDTPIFRKGRAVYGIHLAWHALSDTKQAVVVEGYTDVISLHQAGLRNVVACMGTALTEDHLAVLGRYVDEVILCYDADAAGVQAALRSVALFEARNVDVRIAVLPPGADPDELVRERGGEAFKSIVADATSVVEYQLQLIFDEHKSRGTEGLTRAAREAVDVLLRIPDRTRRDAFVVRAADRWAAGDTTRHEAMQAALRSEIWRRSARGRAPKGTPVADRDRSFITEALARGPAELPRWREEVERELLSLALQDQTVGQQIVEVLETEDLADPRHQRLWIALREHLAAGGEFAPHQVIDSLEEVEGTRARGVELLLTDTEMEDTQEVIAAAAAKLRKHRLGAGLREKYVVPEESPIPQDMATDEDFQALQQRISERINRGELSHDDPDYLRYQRLVASFHGKGSADFIDARSAVSAGNDDSSPSSGAADEAADIANEPSSEGS